MMFRPWWNKPSSSVSQMRHEDGFASGSESSTQSFNSETSDMASFSCSQSFELASVSLFAIDSTLIGGRFDSVSHGYGWPGA